MILAYVVFLVILLVKRRRLSDLPFIIIVCLTFFLAVKSRRYVAPFVIATLPFLALFLEDLNLNLKKYKVTAFVFVIFIIIALETGINSVLQNKILTFNFDDYCTMGSNCSPAFADYLVKNPPAGKGFSFYDWGGFFIGTGVPAKYFVDGRMHLWENGEYRPYFEYQAIYYEDDDKKFKSYNFDWVAVPTNSNIAQKLRDGVDLGKWVEAYNDNRASYFVKLK